MVYRSPIGLRRSLTQGTSTSFPLKSESSIDHRLWSVGNVSKVVVVTATDLRSIWVQSCSAEILRILDQIQKGLKILEAADVPDPFPSVGSYVGAVFTGDGQLYRAQIQSLDMLKSLVVVRFVDFGNLAEVPIDQIRTLPDGLLKPKACCSHVALFNVDTPVAGTPPSLADFLNKITDQVFDLLVIDNGSNGTVHGLLSRGNSVLNEVIKDMLDDFSASSEAATVIESSDAATKVSTAHETSTKPMLDLTLASPVQQSPPDNALGRFFYEDGPFVDMPELGSVQFSILLCQSPQIIHVTTTDRTIHQKIADLQVSHFLGNRKVFMRHHNNKYSIYFHQEYITGTIASV